MSIKNLMYRMSMLLAVCLLVTSCGKDDEVVIVDVEGINVADGFYMMQPGVDPTGNDILTSETVEDKDFGSQERDGFIAGYIWLNAGDYNMVEIATKEITKTFGGTASTETSAGGVDYTLVTGVADAGAAVAVSTAGLYKVTYDQKTSEMVMYPITTVSIIGSATPGGWGTATDLAGSATATGGTWSGTDIEMREGEFKIRFGEWNLDRRIDPTLAEPYVETNGYQFFLNYGGTLDNLLPGNDGANIPIAATEEGKYTIDVTWAKGVFTAAKTKTGDVDPITFVPDDHQWGIIGDATPTGWDSDTDFNYEGVNAGTYSWKLTGIALTSGGSFKLRANDAWDEELNWDTLTMEGDTGDLSNGGTDTNIYVDADGSYDITLTTSDEGDNYTATFTKL